MKPFKDVEDEMKAYETGPLEKLSIQDAVIIIAVYAARIDPENSEADIRRIESLAENCPVCIERKKGILSRINNFVNVMRTVDPEKAIEAALKILDAKSTKEAFDLAAKVVVSGDGSPDQKRKILYDLAEKMSIDHHFANATITPMLSPR